jgi:CRP/FNR family transcriptional regulator
MSKVIVLQMALNIFLCIKIQFMGKNSKVQITIAKKPGKSLISPNPILSELLELAKTKQFFALNKNDKLFLENEHVKGVYFLLSGKIKITKKDFELNDSVLYMIKAPDIVCLHSIMEEEFHVHSAVAAVDSMVCFVPKKEFEKILAQNMTIAFNMMKMLCLKINVIENQINRYI